ncbi:serine/threonine-protein kinase GRIK1-like [Triticum urartu]|uniref:non-specific serine/threonine protein kinase n=1 Tax=Triticum urartu TaxID=4572 RepID=A0A8R7TBP6_TRIUA|nr:serine/threonine-protein kinase GRIK1-like [Triticum urartu]XP_048552481.1 serine/threonine-protein kinase GRIK1-like [Triticum urartu]
MSCCCCSCFGFLSKLHHRPAAGDSDGAPSKVLLLPRSSDGGSFYAGDNSSSFLGDESRSFYEREEEDYLLRQSDGDDEPPRKRSEDIILSRARNGFACRDSLVRDTRKLFRSEDETTGCKMINQYVHLGKIGAGSYGKVVKYRNIKDGRLYAIKVLSKPYMLKVRVVRSETAMTDVLREVSLMKMLDHPNIVNLIEVIDDPNTDKFYMVLEYVEGKMVCNNGIGLGEATSRKYLRDIVSGVMYLHSHNIIHGDIKPDNLLVTSTGNVKIGDFSVSQIFEDDDDMLWRSPGTPVFTAPECCQGSAYHGRTADTWAVGVTLYCMITGKYPFLGETLQETYDKIANDPVEIPGDTSPQLADLMQRLLYKDPGDRMTLQAVAAHPWVAGAEGPVPEFVCRCGFGRRNRSDSQEAVQ